MIDIVKALRGKICRPDEGCAWAAIRESGRELALMYSGSRKDGCYNFKAQDHRGTTYIATHWMPLPENPT